MFGVDDLISGGSALLDWLGEGGSSFLDWGNSSGAFDLGVKALLAATPTLAQAGIQSLMRPNAPSNPLGAGFTLPAQPTATGATGPSTAISPNARDDENQPVTATRPSQGLMIDDRLRRMQRGNSGGFQAGV